MTLLPAESTLQKIIRLIQTAQKLKAPSERFTDRFGTGYTYAVIGAAAAMFLVLVARLPPAGVRQSAGRALGVLPGDDPDGRGEPLRPGAVDSVRDPRGDRLGRPPRRPLPRRRGDRETGRRRTPSPWTRPGP